MKPFDIQTNQGRSSNEAISRQSDDLASNKTRSLDKIVLGVCTALFFLAVAHASEKDMTSSQYHFLKRHLEAEYNTAKAACTSYTVSMRERCIAKATAHRNQAEDELKRKGTSRGLPK